MMLPAGDQQGTSHACRWDEEFRCSSEDRRGVSRGLVYSACGAHGRESNHNSEDRWVMGRPLLERMHTPGMCPHPGQALA